MKRRHQVVLFAVLLLSLTILSPSFDFRGSQHNEGRNQEKDTYPGTSFRSEDTHAPLNIVVAMSKKEFAAFQKLAKEVAASRYIEVNVRNVKPEEFKDVLDEEFSLGDNGDIILLDSEQVQYYARKGYLVPLNGTTLSKSLGDTAAELRGMTEWNGYQWGLPFDFDPYVFAASASLLNKAGVQGLPQTRHQWSKLIKTSQTEGTPLIAINIDDIYGAGAWMNYLTPGMSPDQILNISSSSRVIELQQGISLLNELRPQIMTLSADPVLSASDYKVKTPMFVSTLSRILQADETAEGRGTFKSPLPLQSLQAVEARSLVITSGSVEVDAASRWIEGMTAAAVQRNWYKQTKRLPAGKQWNEQEAKNVDGHYGTVQNQSWFSKNFSPLQWAESRVIILRFKKQVHQVLTGEINAAQYVSSIQKAYTP